MSREAKRRRGDIYTITDCLGDDQGEVDGMDAPEPDTGQEVHRSSESGGDEGVWRRENDSILVVYHGR